MKNIQGKVAAIGDLHGEYDDTRRMLACLKKYKLLKDRTVVFLGDYVDMGPDTAKLIELLILFKEKIHPQTEFCCGNHDLNLIKALGLVPSPEKSFYRNRAWQRNRDTLKSYGAKNIDELDEKMPDNHKEFLANLLWAVDHPDYLFVHVGIDSHEDYTPQILALAEQNTVTHKPKWLYSDRLSFQSPDCKKTVVSGHMILNDAMAFPNRRLIDTGCGYGGYLTTLLLPEDEVVQPEENGDRFFKNPIVVSKRA
jgi:serine/threonine protein phosphatase 1